MNLYVKNIKQYRFDEEVLNILKQIKDVDELRTYIELMPKNDRYSDSKLKSLNVFIDKIILGFSSEEVCLKYSITKSYLQPLIQKGYFLLRIILFNNCFTYFELYKELVKFSKETDLNLNDDKLYRMFRDLIVCAGCTKENLKEYLSNVKFGQWDVESISLEVRDLMCEYYNIPKPEETFMSNVIKIDSEQERKISLIINICSHYKHTEMINELMFNKVNGIEKEACIIFYKMYVLGSNYDELRLEYDYNNNELNKLCNEGVEIFYNLFEKYTPSVLNSDKFLDKESIIEK